MEDEIMKLMKQIENLDWRVNKEREDSTCLELQKYSPAGQDFFITIDTENDRDIFLENLYSYYENYDISYETYLWLDELGHGRNGAPYDMRDLYNDMEACEQMVYDLYHSLININD